MDDKNQPVKCCGYCGDNAIVQKQIGSEYYDYCTTCDGVVEGNTIMIRQEE